MASDFLIYIDWRDPEDRFLPRHMLTGRRVVTGAIFLGSVCVGTAFGYILSSIVIALGGELILPQMTILTIPWPEFLDFSLSDPGILVFLGLQASPHVIYTWINSHVQSQLVLTSIVGGAAGGLTAALRRLLFEEFIDKTSRLALLEALPNAVSFTMALALLVAVLALNVVVGDAPIIALGYVALLVAVWAWLALEMVSFGLSWISLQKLEQMASSWIGV